MYFSTLENEVLRLLAKKVKSDKWAIYKNKNFTCNICGFTNTNFIRLEFIVLHGRDHVKNFNLLKFI